MKEENFINAAGLIALRKAEFYNSVLEEAKKKNIAIDKEIVKQKIADMKNEYFLSEEEKKTKKLDTKTIIESLGLNKDEFLITNT